MDEPNLHIPTPIVHGPKPSRLPTWLRLTLYILPVPIVAAAVYFFLAPFIISTYYPQYGVMNTYKNAVMCTDVASDAATTFTPSCASVAANTASHMIGCIYQDATTYMAPTQASDDQLIVCPELVSKLLPSGQTSPGLPVLAVSEQSLRLTYTSIISGIVTGLYAIILLIVWLVRTKKH